MVLIGMSVKNIVDTSASTIKNKVKNKIIIVDDDEDHLLFYTFIFRTFNNENEYIPFNNPEKALNYINKLENQDYRRIFKENNRITLIISDYNMFPLNGLDFFKKLKKSNMNIPFIIMSSFISDSVRTEAQNLGVLDCLSKRTDPKQIFSEMGNYLV